MASFIIVNWNGRDLLKNCLESVLRQTYQSFEIICVDNGSTDGSVPFLKKHFPSVRIVALSDNCGFTGGNIAGLDHAQGQFIALLNNDAILTERWLEHMVMTINNDNSIGMCSSKIIIAGTNRIDSVGDAFTTALNGTKVGELQPEERFTVSCSFPGACAAAVLYRRKMFDDIGFLDNDFFLNHEDTDLNMRAWLSGWKCIFVPDARVYHKVSASLGVLSDTSIYYFARNNEWVWIKNVPFPLMLRYLPHRIIYELASFGYFCVIKRKWRPFLKGKLDALKKLPLMLQKRKSVQKLVRISHEQIKRELIPISSYLRQRLQNLHVD